MTSANKREHNKKILEQIDEIWKRTLIEGRSEKDLTCEEEVEMEKLISELQQLEEGE